MAGRSPSALVAEWYRNQGWMVDTVERYNSFIHQRKDCFGVADLVAVHPCVRGTTYLQVSGLSNHGTHIRKMEEPHLAANIKTLLEAGNSYIIISPRKKKRLELQRFRVSRYEISMGAVVISEEEYS